MLLMCINSYIVSELNDVILSIFKKVKTKFDTSTMWGKNIINIKIRDFGWNDKTNMLKSIVS